MKLYQCSWIYHSHLRFRLTLRDIHRWFAKLERAATSVARSTTLPGCGWHHNAYPPETTAGGCGLREADSQSTCSFTKEGLEMLMECTDWHCRRRSHTFASAEAKRPAQSFQLLQFQYQYRSFSPVILISQIILFFLWKYEIKFMVYFAWRKQYNFFRFQI